uniref:Enoyl reductase (ER) domain-containing protein n=1 Tax=Cyclophora tenuis TaxID=216820 RepID=A0A7S1DBV1_CYCTE|mmetsp:Transcript_6744/g.11783  ORF Transcript_6744/g.11783 Transcript_6744/m.11783 type:complete len:293 (+) Transcript_6744:116-994(+)
MAAIDTALDAVVNKLQFSSMLHSYKGDHLMLGWHFAGTIEKIGDKVENLRVGDDVFGHLQYDSKTIQGSFSEYITVPASDCAKKPADVPFDVAAASTTEAITALQAVRDHGGFEEAQRILILGGGGGVGSAAVQIAKALGASHITATCSARDVERVRSNGADVVVDRGAKDPKDIQDSFHVVFDSTGLYSAYDFLSKIHKEGGRFVTTLPNVGFLLATAMTFVNCKKQGVSFVHAMSKRQDLELVGEWLSSSKLQIPIDSTFKVKDMKDAMARQADRAKVGRVIIDVANGWE